jgi:Animal haem peroxidase
MASPSSPHGTGLRGLTLGVQSSSSEGRFGRLFRNLRGAKYSDDELKFLGFALTADIEPIFGKDGQAIADAPDAEENVGTQKDPGIAAGYTYVGQFIDHDITFDPSSINERIHDLDSLTNFRTPRLDLDSVYGRGPDHQPYLYDNDGVKMLLGPQLGGNPDDRGACDLPRNRNAADQADRALIGDKRNDENRIIAQLHVGFLRFHNATVDLLTKDLGRKPTFGQVRQFVMYHYQWAVIHDFLPTMVGPALVKDIMPHIDLATGKDTSHYIDKPKFRFYLPNQQAYIPLEFAVAAYRFGHAMIRPTYRLNSNIVKSIFKTKDIKENDDLGGFRPIPPGWAIEWARFFGTPGASPNGQRVQPSYKIDTSLAHPLLHLPGFDEEPRELAPTLAWRNLRRGMDLSIPSGEDVARAMGEKVLTSDEIWIGKAAHDDVSRVQLSQLQHTEFSKDGKRTFTKELQKSPFVGKTPLWVYVLAEAMQPTLQAIKARPGDSRVDNTPTRLGPVGGRIVAEVLAGILFDDSTSYLNVDPLFRPHPRVSAKGGKFGFQQLLALATTG